MSTERASVANFSKQKSTQCLPEENNNAGTWSKLPLLKSFMLPKKKADAQKHRILSVVLRDLLASFPPESNGLALGLCGASALALGLQEAYFPGVVGTRRALAAFGGVPSAIIWTFFGLRCCLIAMRGKLRAEFSQPKLIAAYAAWGLVYLVGCGRLEYASKSTARFFFYVGTVAQPIVTIAFLRVVFTQNLNVEPYFNPAVVNPVVVTMVGWSLVGAQHHCHIVINASFALAALATFVVMPLQLKNVLWIDHRERSIRAVAVMQAPLATIFVACGMLRQNDYCAFDKIRDLIFVSLFAASVVVTWLTAYAVYLRRRLIFERLSVDHASFTFPTCASARAAIVFAADGFTSDRPILRRVAEAYSLVLSVAALVLTVVIASRLAWRAFTCTLEEISNSTIRQPNIKPAGIIPIADLGEGDTVELPCPRETSVDHHLPEVSENTPSTKGCHAKKLLGIFVDNKDVTIDYQGANVDDIIAKSPRTTSSSSTFRKDGNDRSSLMTRVVRLFNTPRSTVHEESNEQSAADSTPAKLVAMRIEHNFTQ